MLSKFFNRTELIWTGFVLLMTLIVFLLLTDFQLRGSLSLEVNDTDYFFSNAQLFLAILGFYLAFYWLSLGFKTMGGINTFFKNLSVILISVITICLLITSVIVFIYQDAFGKFPLTKVLSVILFFNGLTAMYFIRSIEIIKTTPAS